jgi:hypothetical protein
MYEGGDREKKCNICGHIIGKPARRYWNKDTKVVICSNCYDDEQHYYGRTTNPLLSSVVQLPTDTTTTTGVGVRSTTTTIPPVGPPLDGWAKGHDENMKSAELTRVAVQALTAAIVDLMRVEEDRNKLLVRNMEAKA